MPLGELKKFIETNKHLPGIPAAAVVEKEGFELGEMQRKLLEKVEEVIRRSGSLKINYRLKINL